MSRVCHSLADVIQCIVHTHEWCFVSRKSGCQILLSRWMCDLHVVAMATEYHLSTHDVIKLHNHT